jgi:2-polyprenyl-3-methyl-5-hydroxy-6-metoxy-1,4-benzoquinol methylase
MKNPTTSKPEHEIAHGKTILKNRNPELVWGWGTPAGKLRAARRAQLIASGADLLPGKKILEIGCGTGNFTERFAEYGSNILAVDISPDLLDEARKRSFPKKNVTFLLKRFEECDLDGPFDAVIGSSILHHLLIEESLRKIFSLLKPGGMMSFAEPNLRNPQVFIERTFRFIRPLFWYISPDETAFIRSGLERKLREIGFSDISIRPFDWLHPSTPSQWIPAVQKLGVMLEKTPLLREFSGSLIIRAVRPALS